MTTGNGSPSGEREKWDRIYQEQPDSGLPEPAAVLAENAHLLPDSGVALDVACGRGGNALFLARRGLVTMAWDLSPAAIHRLAASADGLPLNAAVRDVIAAPPPPDSADVIVVSRFLNRGLAPALSAALRPGGLLFYQTFARDRVSGRGPSNPEFRLAANELLQLFGTLRVVFYREEGKIGDLAAGFRDEAQFIGLRC